MDTGQKVERRALALFRAHPALMHNDAHVRNQRCAMGRVVRAGQ